MSDWVYFFLHAVFDGLWIDSESDSIIVDESCCSVHQSSESFVSNFTAYVSTCIIMTLQDYRMQAGSRFLLNRQITTSTAPKYGLLISNCQLLDRNKHAAHESSSLANT